MKGFTLGQYYPGNSILHRLDPRAKIILGILAIVCTFLCKTLFSFLLLFALTVFLAILSRIPIKILLRSLRPVFFILVFTSLVNILMTKGDHLLLEFWIFHIYEEGLWNALFMIVRITSLIVMTGIFLTYTTTPIALTDGLEQLLSPLKKLHIPVHDFAMMITIALRFIPTLAEETERIMNAQRARGVNFSSGGLFKRVRSLIPILIPLFVSAFNRAFDLANAMECRCYHGGEGRTRLKVLRYQAADFIAMILLLGIGVGLFFANRLTFGGMIR